MNPIKEIIELTKKLISFRSTHDRPEEIRKCCLFVSDWFAVHGIEHRCIENSGYLSLVVMPKPDYTPVLLMSHLDVVAGPGQLFIPRMEGNILWGRGSIDDKYAVALSMVLLKEILAQRPGADSNWPVGLLITSDEEIGGKQGAGKILPSIRTDFGIALDGGRPGSIVVKEKGILKIRLTTRGKSAHGSRPWLGKNAITALLADIQAIMGLFEPYPDDPGHWHRTCNVGLISGGRVSNQVPDLAEAILDVRFTENDNPDLLVAEMQAAVQGTLVVEERAQMLVSRPSSHLDLLLECCPGASLEAEHGSSDARYLTQFGMNGVVWGADGQMSQHSDNEHVLVPSIELVYQRLLQFIKQLDKTG